MHGLVEQVESAIELEEVVQLRHKVQRDSPTAGSAFSGAGLKVGELVRLRAAAGLPFAVEAVIHVEIQGVWKQSGSDLKRIWIYGVARGGDGLARLLAETEAARVER